MRQELNDPLCQRYPDMSETGMGWGFGCGDGWFDIIDGLCAEITNQVKAGTMPPVIASQVKEKYGYLRLYIRGHFNRDNSREAHRLIDLAQQKAERICQECGKLVENDRCAQVSVSERVVLSMTAMRPVGMTFD